MIDIKITFLVKRPIDQVFQHISDISNYWQWVPDKSKFFIENKITSEGPLGVGTTYMDRLKLGGNAIGEVVKYTPPFNVKFQQITSFGLPIFRAWAEYILKCIQDFTEVVHRFEATPCGFFKLLEPVLSSIIRSERERTCEAIKQSLQKEQ